MNIFVVDSDPEIAATNLCDKHVVKMIVEGCQMLSTIHRMGASHIVFAGQVDLYKMAFENHPCTIWARETTANYMWLARHTLELCMQYELRYKKIHKCYDMAFWFTIHLPARVPYGKLTPFAQAMPDIYKNENAVVAYRNYYIFEKSRFAKWKFTDCPNWYTEGIKNVRVPVLQS
jgi:hypothetical protein